MREKIKALQQSIQHKNSTMKGEQLAEELWSTNTRRDTELSNSVLSPQGPLAINKAYRVIPPLLSTCVDGI